MSSSDNNFENSLDSALNMSQEEIEKLLNGQGLTENNAPDYEAADLESLLSELEAMEDDDIQEISDLLDKAENNEAADPEIMDLLNMQDEVDDTPAYDAMDLFSAEGEAVPKESFWKRLLARFKKKDKDIEEGQSSEEVEVPKEKKKKEKVPKEKKEKKKKDKSKKQKEVVKDKEQQSGEEPVELDLLNDSLNGSDAIILELEKEEVAKEEAKIKEKPKKKEKVKKKEKTSKKNTKDAEPSEEDEKNKKQKKEKKKKEKKVKEKNIVLYDYDEAPITKKKVSIIFFLCLMFMFALIALLVNYAGHANRKLAEEAFDEGDYLQCYQLLYGQHLNESQEVMFHQSKIQLKMDSLWNRYESFTKEKQYLKGLDKLVQFVYEYPEFHAYATEWNCEEVVDATYGDVLEVLYDEYKLAEQEVVSIANLEDDVEYTKALTSLVEKKEKGMLKYPNMLPEEEDRIGDLAD